METHRILIVGDTLFAEMLAQLLSQNPGIEVLGSAPDLQSVVPLLASSSPDAVIYAKKPEQDEPIFSSFITNNPDLPVLCTELSKNAVQVVISQNIYVHSSKDLLTVIQTLRKRR
jgi:DNA-binding NarL/FixJ family response regulator